MTSLNNIDQPNKISDIQQFIEVYFSNSDEKKQKEIQFIHSVLENISKRGYNTCYVSSESDEITPPLNGYFDALKRIVEQSQVTISLKNSDETTEISILINNGCDDGESFAEWMVSSSEDINIYEMIGKEIELSSELHYGDPF